MVEEDLFLVFFADFSGDSYFVSFYNLREDLLAGYYLFSFFGAVAAFLPFALAFKLFLTSFVVFLLTAFFTFLFGRVAL